jgi:hypothetical protein
MGKKKSESAFAGLFVGVHVSTLESDAWRMLSHGAKALYFFLLSKLDVRPGKRNNGEIWLSCRDARQKLGSGHEEIVRWFAELKYYGFIVECEPAKLTSHPGKGRAPHLRLTEHKFKDKMPTNDFLHFGGVAFAYAPRSRPGRIPDHYGVVGLPKVVGFP